jgi:hypothetical protein
MQTTLITEVLDMTTLSKLAPLGLIYTLRCGNIFILASIQLAESQYENVAATQCIIDVKEPVRWLPMHLYAPFTCGAQQTLF